MIDLVINDYVDFKQSNPLRKLYEWKTDVVTFDSGVEQRNQIWQRPLRRWFLNWSMIEVTERNHLIQLFQRARGSYHTFKIKDVDDYAITGGTYAIAGAVDTLQLTATYYDGETEEWTENKTLIVPASIITLEHSVAGTLNETTHWTLDDNTGIITFISAPGVGTITASFEYYFLCRFTEDNHLDSMPEVDLYSNPDIPLVEVLL